VCFGLTTGGEKSPSKFSLLLLRLSNAAQGKLKGLSSVETEFSPFISYAHVIWLHRG